MSRCAEAVRLEVGCLAAPNHPLQQTAGHDGCSRFNGSPAPPLLSFTVRYPPLAMPIDRPISEAEVIGALTESGASLDDYVLLAGDMPGFVNERGEMAAMIIEDDALAAACVEFLRARGARVVAVGRGG